MSLRSSSTRLSLFLLCIGGLLFDDVLCARTRPRVTGEAKQRHPVTVYPVWAFGWGLPVKETVLAAQGLVASGGARPDFVPDGSTCCCKPTACTKRAKDREDTFDWDTLYKYSEGGKEHKGQKCCKFKEKCTGRYHEDRGESREWMCMGQHMHPQNQAEAAAARQQQQQQPRVSQGLPTPRSADPWIAIQPGAIQPGAQVIIHGLQDPAWIHLNGQPGSISTTRDFHLNGQGFGTWSVRLRSSGELLDVRPVNLRAAALASPGGPGHDWIPTSLVEVGVAM